MRLTQHTDWKRLPFPRDEYERRVSALRSGMQGKGLDGLIVCGAPKRSGYVRYIANFESYIGTTLVVIPLSGALVLITDSHFRQEPMQAGIWTTWIDEVRWAPHSSLYILEPGELIGELKDALQGLGLSKGVLGFIGEERLYPALHEGLRSLISRERWKDGSTLFHEVASRKSSAEIDLFHRFGKMMDVAIDEFLLALKPGITESELFGVIMGSLFRQGVQNFFGTVPPVLVSGDRARLKSVPPSLKKIEAGDPVFFDLEPELEGYYLDIARSVAVGKPSDPIRRIIEASQAIEQAVFEGIKPGVSMRLLQEVAFRAARKAGLEKFYYFKFHGQGTMRPAYPFPSQLDFVLDTGMVFTIESIIVDPELTTGTIENAYLVTKNGAERLVKGALRPN